MTENVTTVTGVGATLPSNTTIGADNISSVYYERVKIAQGDTGTAVDVSSGAPLWVNVATTGNILGTFTTSTGTIGAVLQGTSPWVTSPSSQWTVSVTPTSAIAVTGSFAVSSSTVVIGAVFPSTQWTVTTTPSSQATVTVQPTTQWTVSVTPTTQFTVTTTPSSSYSVGVTSGTITLTSGSLKLGGIYLSSSTSTSIVANPIIGAVSPSTQWTVTTTPSSNINVTTTPSSVFQISASAEVASMFNGTAAVTPTFASLACSSSGANQIVAPVSAKSIYLINAYLVAAGAVNLNFCSSGSSVSYGGVTALSSNAGYVLPFSPVGWLQSTTTGGLYLNLSAAVQVGGGVTYVSF